MTVEWIRGETPMVIPCTAVRMCASWLVGLSKPENGRPQELPEFSALASPGR
jgi:hypothetical protein